MQGRRDRRLGRAALLVVESFTDPTHRRFFSRFTFDYFNEAHDLSFYTPARFRLLTVQLIFQPRLLNKIVWRLANRFPRVYEERWAWLFPAWFVYPKLQAVKGGSRGKSD